MNSSSYYGLFVSLPCLRGESWRLFVARVIYATCCSPIVLVVSFSCVVASCTLVRRLVRCCLLFCPSNNLRPSPLLQARHYSPQRHPSLHPWHFITVLYSCDACSVVLPLFDFDCMRCGLLPSSKIRECRLLICASHLAIHQLFVHVRGFGLLRFASFLQLRSLLGGHWPFYVIGPLPYSCDP